MDHSQHHQSEQVNDTVSHLITTTTNTTMSPTTTNDHNMMRMMMMMQWNWSTQQFYVVFSWWKIDSSIDFGITILIVYLLALLYERIQAERSQLEDRIIINNNKPIRSYRGRGRPSPSSSSSSTHADSLPIHAEPLLENLPTNYNNHSLPSSSSSVSPVGKQLYYRTALMSTSYALSIFLMLIFMTYNGWIILAAIAGATTGFHQFRTPGSKFGLDKSCCD